LLFQPQARGAFPEAGQPTGCSRRTSFAGLSSRSTMNFEMAQMIHVRPVRILYLRD
jgi:hypothetical protein